MVAASFAPLRPRAVLGGSVIALLLAAPAAARDLTNDESGALSDAVEAFNAAMSSKDFAALGATIPPRLFAAMAAEAKLDQATLREALIDQMTQSMAAVKFDSFSMDLAAASHEEGADGSPYVLIPTVTVIDINGAKTEVGSKTLGLLDGGKWYLLRVDPSQVSLIKRVYPQFSDVTFEPGTMKAVKQ